MKIDFTEFRYNRKLIIVKTYPQIIIFILLLIEAAGVMIFDELLSSPASSIMYTV